jgi:hypothetical protein
MSKMDAECVRREIEARIAQCGGNQSALARELALGPGGQALISKLLRGEPVSVATLRRIGRALGCVPQPRRLIRRVLTPQEAAAWDALAPPERLRRLTQ